MKICPILAAGDPGYNAQPGVQCKGKLCAWWDEERSMCALVSAAVALGEVAENLEDMQHKAD